MDEVIYALLDPGTEAVRYVGKSIDPVRRLDQHLQPSHLRKNNHRTFWLRKLKEEGKVPLLRILAKVPPESGAAVEKYYILVHRESGCRLTNGSVGGEGGPPERLRGIPNRRPSRLGTKHSPESKLRMRLAKLGKKNSPEHIAKVAASNTGRHPTPETRALLSLRSREREARKREQRHDASRANTQVVPQTLACATG